MYPSDSINLDYSVFNPNKVRPLGLLSKTTAPQTEKDMTCDAGSVARTDVTAEKLLTVMLELNKQVQTSFEVVQSKVASLGARIDRLDGTCLLAGSGNRDMPPAPRTPNLLNNGLYPQPLTQPVDVEGRFVRPLVGAALTANRYADGESGLRRTERIELGSGADTPGRPGSRLPTKLDSSLPLRLSGSLPTLFTTGETEPTSGLTLAYLLVVSHTVLVPQGERFQLDQQLIGDQWLPLCTGQTSSPMLGKALMQFGIRIDDRPFDPTIIPREWLTQRARNLFYVPIVTSIDETRLALPEFARLSLDTVEAARELVTVSVSRPEAWPSDWVTMNPPDYFALVRVHIGFDRMMYHQLINIYSTMALRQQLSLVRHTLADVLQNMGVHVSAITASLSGRRVLSYLDARYNVSEHEQVPLNLLVQMSAQPPSLYDTEANTGRPVRLPDGERDHARDVDPASNSRRGHSDRTPDLKSALCVQISKIEPISLKSWSKGSIQWWNLRFIHAFTHGVMKCMIDMLLAHGAVNAYDALKTLVIDRIGERFPHFIDVFTYPNFVTLLSDTIATQAVSMQAVIANADVDSVQGVQQRAEQFVQGLCRILLVIRSIPYSATLDEMARSEMKRLQSIKRPEGLSDPQWWTDVARRFRSWLTLEGRDTMAQAGSELRDFLHAMLMQVSDRHMRNEIIRLANTWVAGLPAHFNKPSLYALLQYEIAPSTRAPMYPKLNGSTHSAAPNIAVFEKSQDLRLVYDMGDGLRKQGHNTSGPDFLNLLLDFTVKYVGEHGAAAAMAGPTGEAHVLLMKSAEAGPDGILDANILINDVLYATEPWPDVRAFATDVAPTGALNTQKTVSRTKTQQTQHFLHVDEHKLQPTDPSPTTPRLCTPGTPAAWEPEIKRLEGLISNSSSHITTQLAHFGDLIRTQLQMVAPPALRHATPANNFSTSRTLLTDADHDADKLRKNMGGGGASNAGKSLGGNVRRSVPRQGMRYMDKPAIRWAELDDAAKTHLASALDISCEADWLAKSNVVCPLCPEKDHLLDRCLSMWCCTNQGRKFFGADKAALRFRKHLTARRSSPINLMDIFAAYEAACVECDPDGSELVFDGFQKILDQSQTLAMICDGTIDEFDQVFAVHEFDTARETFLAHCGRASK